MRFIFSRFFIFSITVTAVHFLSAAVHAQDMPVPLHVQAQLFKKILGYSLSLSDAANPKIAIVEPSGGAGTAIQDAFTRNKLEKTQLDRKSVV